MVRQTEVKSKNRPRPNATGTGLAEYARRQDEQHPIYKDNYAMQSMKAVDLRDQMKKETGWDETFDRIQELHLDHGYDLRDASRKVRDEQMKEEQKTLLSGDLSQAVFVTDQVILTATEATPLASELMPRRAVSEVTVRLDEVTDVGSASSHPEGGDYHSGSATYGKEEFSVEEYSTKRKFSDKARLSLERYDVEQTKITIAEEAMLQYEEAQILQGTNNDVDGFNGLLDYANSDGVVQDGTGVSDRIKQARDIITELRQGGNSSGHVPYDDILIVTDVVTFRELKDELDDIQRFRPVEDGRRFEFGLQALDVDGVPIVESDGLPNADGSRKMFAYDTSAWAMYHLADHTLQPLPREDTLEVFALYAIGVLGSGAPSRVVVKDNIGA